jgi:hypothetical protein
LILDLDLTSIYHPAAAAMKAAAASLLRWPSSSQYSLLPLGGHLADHAAADQEGKQHHDDASSQGPTSNSAKRPLRHLLRLCAKRTWLTVIVVILIIVSLIGISSSASRRRRQSILKGPTSIPTFDSYMGDVVSFLHTPPSTSADNTTFGQMGLFTRLYARLIEDVSASKKFLESFETSLWFFAPGISMTRSRHIFNRTTEDRRHEQGIIIPVGKGAFLFANHLISTIRDVHKSELPIDIVYRDEVDLPNNLRSYLTSTYTNVHTTELASSGIFNDGVAGMHGWSIKPFAAIATEFTQVLMVDADVIFLTRPEDFFEQEDYQKTGTLFFSDRKVSRKGKETKGQVIRDWLLQQLGVIDPTPSQSLEQSYFWQTHGIHRQESGVVVVDKSRPQVFAALFFTAWQNIRAIRDKVTYKLFWGDKETFWLAFELAKFPYYMNNHGAGSLGSDDDVDKTKEFCVEHPLHFFEGPKGSPTLENMKENPPLPLDQRPLLRPAWLNGSMRKNKINRTSKQFIEVEKAIWSMDGIWIWGEEEKLNCQRDFTRHKMDEFNLYSLFVELQRTAKAAEDKAQRHLDSL